MSVYLDFMGGAGEVTGSRTVLRTNGAGNNPSKTFSTLIDCGLFQGPSDSRARNWEATKPGPTEIAAIVLTHAHLDHSGRLPRFCQEGYAGPIYCTKGTAELGKILLLDAAFLEEEQAAYARKTGYSHHKPALPLFTEADANLAVDQFKQVPRNQWQALNSEVQFQFLRAGHITGASLAQFSIDMNGVKKIITFSGDLGNHRSITMRPPVDLAETDILVLESTYGSRIHTRMPGSALLSDVINRTMDRKGVLVIPAFAVGRTQEILFMIRQLEDNKTIPSVPVILDSPMAAAATKNFLQHPEDHLIEIASNGDATGFLPRQFEATHSTKESMAACLKDGPIIVISASGMLSGGRILHHLRTRLPNPKNTVLFVGYQAEGSKGHYLQNEGKACGRMRIFHTEVPIGAEIASIDNLSAHADQQDLVEWVGRIQKRPQKIFLNHGTKKSADQLADQIRRRFPTIDVTSLDAATSIQIYK